MLAGSALNGEGVDALMQAVAALCRTDWETRAAEPFAAQVYRVRRVGGVRYAYIRATAGTLRARDEVETMQGAQKVSALCAAQGGKLAPLAQLAPGQTAAVAGLSARPGERIGAGCGEGARELAPLMSVHVLPKAPLDKSALLAHLRELEEEDPPLCVRPEADGVSVGVMGAVQVEVLQNVLTSRFGDAVEMLPPRVLYRETVAAPVTGIGHYDRCATTRRRGCASSPARRAAAWRLRRTARPTRWIRTGSA